MASKKDLRDILIWSLQFATTVEDLMSWAKCEKNLVAIGILNDGDKDILRAEWAKRRNELRASGHERQ